jgi:hypothetical protein
MATLKNIVTGQDVEIKPETIVFGNLGAIVANPKTFSSGSIGLFANGKLQDENGNSYQVTCSITLIGSKPKAE